MGLAQTHQILAAIDKTKLIPCVYCSDDARDQKKPPGENETSFQAHRDKRSVSDGWVRYDS